MGDKLAVVRPPSAIAGKSVAYTGTAGNTGTFAAVGDGPQAPDSVMVWCSSDAYVVVGGASVVATANDTPIPANTPVWLPIPDNTNAWRVSAIQISAGGTLYAKPFN